MTILCDILLKLPQEKKYTKCQPKKVGILIQTFYHQVDYERMTLDSPNIA